MKIAVTGANGRIGRNVVKIALRKGHVVHGVDSTEPKTDVEKPEHYQHSEFTFEKMDLRDYDETLRVLKGADAVIHLAGVAQPFDYAVNTHNTNVVISWNVLRACAELSIQRIAQASSVNVIRLVWSAGPKLHYLPLDEEHPREPDEPYGLSKLICEIQADTIVNRWPNMRIASLRPSWAIPNKEFAQHSDPERRKNDLWGWVQDDAVAEAFLQAVVVENGRWKGHEAFFVTAPTVTEDNGPEELYAKYWKHIPLKPGRNLSKGFFDCSKAEQLLEWTHRDSPDELA